MAFRARLAPPREVQQEWPWHKAKTSSLPVSLMLGGERRMEAENYLARGFSIRLIIEAKPAGWMRLSEVAKTWQPSRLKGIQVSPEFGTPFLAATQAYDLRPVPRKWLSLDRTHNVGDRFVSPGTILVTCSGNVGRATLAHSTIDGMLVSHDLLRIDALDPDWRGWIYAYLRAPRVREMMKAAQYGHIIKHLEVSHLDAVPIVEVHDTALMEHCNHIVSEILSKRDLAVTTLKTAEEEFASQFAQLTNIDTGEAGFTTRASQAFLNQRRRFDAWNHNPSIDQIENSLSEGNSGWVCIENAGFEVWLPNRFKRVNAQDGADLVDSSSIFEINPDYSRRIADSGIADRNNGRVEKGWMMMSRSGQIYGLLGSVAMATSEHEGKIVSDDVIRIAPKNQSIHEGYVYIALTHPILGRPRVKALAYGSSIPHIDVADLAKLKIPRLSETLETHIGGLASEACNLWAEADRLENELAGFAEDVLSDFLTGNTHPSN